MASITQEYLAETVSSAPFCTFCLREKPPTIEFYKQVVDSTAELRASFQSMLGYDFQLANFSICKPCWKLMQLVQDFRLRCFKANSLVERIGEGLKSDDDWFSVKNLATIESVRMVIKDQVAQIGRVEAAEDDHETAGLTSQDQTEELVSTVEVVEVKIESNVEVEHVEATKSADKEIPAEFNDSKPLPPRTSLDVQVCIKCNRTLGNLRALKVHLFTCGEQKDKRRIITCHICTATFKHRFQLQSHLNVHAGKTPYECNLCKTAFVCEKTRNLHLKHCEKQIVKCELCDAKLLNNQQLLEHYRRVHPGEQRHQCSQCDMRFTARLTLLRHERKMHLKNLPPNHSCPECGKRFAWESDLKSHLRYHRRGGRSYQCKVCEKMVIGKRTLKEHVANFHTEDATGKSL